ncbi:MAG: hypothetical protein NTZ39_01720 [Methanoregula sp.]|nr:hypothetical protein [Methanoregula sp.]
MDNFSIQVDDNFLATLPPHVQDDLTKDIEEYSGENSGCDCFIRMCPYCTVLVAFLRSGTDDNNGRTLQACAHCGETTPYDKCKQSIGKAKILCDLSVSAASKEGPGEKKKEEREEERVLQEQCIVVLASGILVFLRELYGLCMDLAYVKPEFSLYAKFNTGAHIDRVLPGDVIDRFKTELKMDLSEILGNDRIKKLHLLLLKRDAIVYKNSRADTTFLNNSGIQGKVGSRIPISHLEILDFIRTSEIIVDLLEKECGTLITTGIQDRIKNRLTRSLSILTFETPDPVNKNG